MGGGILGSLVPDDWTGVSRIWLLLAGSVFAFVFVEVVIYAYRFVFTVPFNLHKEQLRQISNLEGARDVALARVQDLQEQLSNRTGDLRSNTERVLALEKQVEAAQRAAAERIGSKDWLALAGDFAANDWRDMAATRITRGEKDQQWRLSGSDCQRGEALCRQAGTMLLKSPHVLESLPGSVLSHSNPTWRWLEYLVERGAEFSRQGSGNEIRRDGTSERVRIDVLEGVAALSANLCRGCATQEIESAT